MLTHLVSGQILAPQCPGAHDTWGVMDRAKHADWSDPEIPGAIVAETLANIDRQRAIRASERRLRRRDRPPRLPIDPDRIPIIVEDEAPHVFHAAGEQDIREILRRLPRGSLDGLRAIRLGIDRRDEKGPLPRDPFDRARRDVPAGRRRTPGHHENPLAVSFLTERDAVAVATGWLVIHDRVGHGRQGLTSRQQWK